GRGAVPGDHRPECTTLSRRDPARKAPLRRAGDRTMSVAMTAVVRDRRSGPVPKGPATAPRPKARKAQSGADLTGERRGLRYRDSSGVATAEPVSGHPLS